MNTQDKRGFGDMLKKLNKQERFELIFALVVAMIGVLLVDHVETSRMNSTSQSQYGIKTHSSIVSTILEVLE